MTAPQPVVCSAGEDDPGVENVLKQRTSHHTYSNLPLLLVLQRNLVLRFAELVEDSLPFLFDK